MMARDEFLTFREQVKLFKDRGMIITDEEKAEKILQFINYYKLKNARYLILKMDNTHKTLLLMRY